MANVHAPVLWLNDTTKSISNQPHRQIIIFLPHCVDRLVSYYFSMLTSNVIILSIILIFLITIIFHIIYSLNKLFSTICSSFMIILIEWDRKKERRVQKIYVLNHVAVCLQFHQSSAEYTQISCTQASRDLHSRGHTFCVLF